MAPAALDGTNLLVSIQPVKAVQVEPRCSVDVLRREGGVAAAVEYISELQSLESLILQLGRYPRGYEQGSGAVLDQAKAARTRNPNHSKA
jgi:hypothetical protein